MAFFGWCDTDDTLQALVREAFTNNYDLRIALTRVEQARQVAAQARSQFVSNVDYSGAVSCRLAG
jgi:multidrug efflux system outer membrane protein